MNPVIMLDEVDKVGADWRGDPSAALLEVLDPAQNHSFRDHYLDVELDLSQVVFIATANVAETIPGPLLDRMEVIRFDGYTVDEKVAIARGYLWPRQRERNGLREDEVEITDELLETIVVRVHPRGRRAPARARARRSCCARSATRIASGDAEPPIAIELDAACATRSAASASGRRPRSARPCPALPPDSRSPAPAATCSSSRRRAWTATSGLVLTGQLGDVMKESAQIAPRGCAPTATSWRSRRSDLHGKSFHVHVPAGAIPKDGPSAGITMTDRARVAADEAAR